MWYKTLVYIGNVLLSNSNFGTFSWVNNVKRQNRARKMEEKKRRRMGKKGERQ